VEISFLATRKSDEPVKIKSEKQKNFKKRINLITLKKKEVK